MKKEVNFQFAIYYSTSFFQVYLGCSKNGSYEQSNDGILLVRNLLIMLCVIFSLPLYAANDAEINQAQTLLRQQLERPIKAVAYPLLV